MNLKAILFNKSIKIFNILENIGANRAYPCLFTNVNYLIMPGCLLKFSGLLLF